MDLIKKPSIKPKYPFFSCGPCKKHPYFNSSLIQRALTSRSHRSVEAVDKLKTALNLTKKILQIPDDYHICMMSGSDTGAMETAIWNLLGYKDIDCWVMGPYSNRWYTDIVDELKLNKRVSVNKVESKYGFAPDNNLLVHNPNNDLVFVWNETPTGVYIPNFDMIHKDRDGLVIVDATSSIFGLHIDWYNIDVLTYSWQKMVGGEAGNGMLILSPRAMKRLNDYIPEHPIPSLYRLRKNGKINYSIFEGVPNNTYSLLLLEDYIMGLEWVNDIGGIKTLQHKVQNNFETVDHWIQQKQWINFLLSDKHKEYRSPISTCLIIKDLLKYNKIIHLLKTEDVAYDISGHRSMPQGVIRIWIGPTIDNNDIQTLLDWIEWAYFTKNN